MSGASTQRENLERAWDVLNENQEVRYFAKRGDGRLLGGRLYSPSALVTAARNLENLGFDVYLHLNPSKGPGLKATSQQVTALRRILIDLDPISPELDATTALQSALLVASEVHSGIFLAAHLLDTGRGAQAWVEIGPASVELSRYERATAEFLQQVRRAWDRRYGYRIDSVCYDLGRIARCPGTRNTKTGRMAQFISGPPIGPIDGPSFLHKFYVEPPKQAAEKPENVSNLMALSPHLNGLAREFLHNGVEEGDRHHAAYVAARNLITLGVPTSDIRFWVARGGDRCRPRLRKRDTEHCISMAIKKEAGNSI